MSLDQRPAPTGRILEPDTVRGLVFLLLAWLIFTGGSVLAQRPNLRPDLLTPLVVFLALEFELVPGLILAVIAGYLADLFSGEPPGSLAFVAGAVFVVLRLFVFRLVGSGALMVTLITVLSTLLALALRVVLRLMAGPRLIELELQPVFWSSVAGALVLAYPMYLLAAALDRRVRQRE